MCPGLGIASDRIPPFTRITVAVVTASYVSVFTTVGYIAKLMGFCCPMLLRVGHIAMVERNHVSISKTYVT